MKCGQYGPNFVSSVKVQFASHKDNIFIGSKISFQFQGRDDVLSFRFFKYGDEKVAAEQGFDASLKLRMASIIYVHTQRFYSELLAFFNHFHQHQNVMNRIREAAMGTTVNETASRGMKLRLDIEAESPLLLLPVSSSSPRLLVVHLGFLRVSVASVVNI